MKPNELILDTIKKYNSSLEYYKLLFNLNFNNPKIIRVSDHNDYRCFRICNELYENMIIFSIPDYRIYTVSSTLTQNLLKETKVTYNEVIGWLESQLASNYGVKFLNYNYPLINR
jgi:hypothetical protein